MMNKHAYYQGQAEAYVKLGFSPEAVYGILTSQGIDKTAAEELTKKAFWGFLGGLAAKAAPKLMGAASAAGKWGAGAAGKGMLGQGAQKAIGGVGQRALGGLGKGMQAFSANPVQALKGGASNFAKGIFGAGGQGIGGTMGRGVQYAGTASALAGMMGGGQPQQQMMQPAGY